MRKVGPLVGVAAVFAAALTFASGGSAGPPGYEQAYAFGATVTINAIEVKQNDHVLAHATADLYTVVYPQVARDAGLVPQCNPCDHNGNGVDPGDYHDHVLDSIPSNPGGGEFSPLWHVFAVVPNYTTDAAHNAAVDAAYLSQLPLKSESAVDAFIDAGYAVEIDTHFYFLCSVVNAHASH
jgi:hypothetical protein